VAKIVVIRAPEGDRVPFLRGILVQSLLSAGLSFQDAYATAQAVREELGNREDVTTTELKAHVALQLEKRFDRAIRLNYETSSARGQKVIVHSQKRRSPFSVGILTRSLEACVIDRESAHEVARRVQRAVLESGDSEIDLPSLRRLIHQSLTRYCSMEAADNYLSRLQFEDSGEPLIILVGGTTGTGKSTVSTELAYLLDVVRTQSTDIMREIIKCYLAPHMVPTLGYSSFEAWRGLPAAETSDRKRETDNPTIVGFLAQFDNVKSALEATIARAVKERHDIIIDGVHILPSKLDLVQASQKAVVVPVVLAVATRQQLGQQLSWRSREQPDRGSSRYLEQLDAIWDVQSFLLNLADKAQVPVIANWTIEHTVRDIMQQVTRRIKERYPPNPGILDQG
jgi:2-phosphoglycerate kinase